MASEPRLELAQMDDHDIARAILPLSWDLIKSRTAQMDHCAIGDVSADATLILSLVLHLVAAKVAQ